MSNMMRTTIPPSKKNKAPETWRGREEEEEEDEGGVSAYHKISFIIDQSKDNMKTKVEKRNLGVEVIFETLLRTRRKCCGWS